MSRRTTKALIRVGLTVFVFLRLSPLDSPVVGQGITESILVELSSNSASSCSDIFYTSFVYSDWGNTNIGIYDLNNPTTSVENTFSMWSPDPPFDGNWTNVCPRDFGDPLTDIPLPPGDYTLVVDGEPEWFCGEGVTLNDCRNSGGYRGEIPFSILTADTPVGTNVEVQPEAVNEIGEPVGTPVTLTFANVISSGMTTVTVLDDPGGNPESAPDFQIGSPPTYFDLETTATFTGQVEVCFDYSQITYAGSEENLRLFHFDENLTNWVDVTILPVDTVNDTICANVDSLSLFSIFEPIPFTVVGLNPPLFDLAPDGHPVIMPIGSFRQGRTLPLQLRLLDDGIALTDNDVTAPMIVAVTLVGGPLGSPVVDLDSGLSNDDSFEFRFAGGFWIYNLGTRELTEAGVYFITIEMPDGFRYRAGFELR